MTGKRAGWRAALVCGTASLFCFLQFMLQGAPGMFVPALMDDLSISPAQIGFISSAFVCTYMICQVPAGLVIDRWGARWAMFVSLLAITFGCLLFSWADTWQMAVLGRMLMGVAAAAGITGCMYLAGNWYPAAWFPLIAGIIEMVAMLGGGAGSVMLEAYDGQWRSAFLDMGVLAAVIAIAIAFFVRDKPAFAKDENLNDPDESDPRALGLVDTLGKLMHLPVFWICAFYGGVIYALISSFAQLWCIPYLNSLYPECQREVAEGTALIFLGLAVGTPLCGMMASLTSKNKPVLVGGAVLVAAAMWVVMYQPLTLLGMSAILFFLGLASGSYALVYGAVRDVVCSRIRATAIALLNALMLLGSPLFQPVSGWLLDRALASQGALDVASYQVAMLPLLACMLLSIPLCFLINEQRPKRPARRLRHAHVWIVRGKWLNCIR